MKGLFKMMVVGALLAWAGMGISGVANAQGNKSNIIGGPLVWAKPVSLGGNPKISKEVWKHLKVRSDRHRATPIPLPGPR